MTLESIAKAERARNIDRLRQERTRTTSFGDCVQLHRERISALRRIAFEFDPPAGAISLERSIARYPFVPTDASTLDERCAEVYSIQVQGLVQRMQASRIDRLVIGVSGGLDSAQALIVATKSMDALQLPRTNILAFTMPGTRKA